MQELLGVEEEKDSGDEEGQEHDESSEYEEYSGSEDEDVGPRLKPVFVRKYDTVIYLLQLRVTSRLNGGAEYAWPYVRTCKCQVIRMQDVKMRLGLGLGADLHMAQLMPLPLTVSCFSKIHIGFTFQVPSSG